MNRARLLVGIVLLLMIFFSGCKSGGGDEFAAYQAPIVEPDPDPDPPILPEPSTMVLLGLSLLGLFGFGKKCKK